MDDGTFEVAVENSSDVDEVEEQPDDEESRYWFSCCLHRIAVVGFRVFAGEEAARAPVVGDEGVRKERLSGMMGDHSEVCCCQDRDHAAGKRRRNEGTMDGVIYCGKM